MGVNQLLFPKRRPYLILLQSNLKEFPSRNVKQGTGLTSTANISK